jgi:uncharacterized protein
MINLKETREGIAFSVFIQPRSSKNMISGIYGDSLKIKLTAPPVEGAANKMCVSFLAKRLGVPKSAVEIISGLSSRKKRILVRYDSDSAETGKDRLKKSVEAMVS